MTISRIVLVAVLVVICGCATQDVADYANSSYNSTLANGDRFIATGTVVLVDFNGKENLLIQVDNGGFYRPDGTLPETYRDPGLRIEFEAEIHDVMSVGTVGRPIKILRVISISYPH